MKAIVVTDQAAGTAGMTLVERPEPHAAINDVVVQVHAASYAKGPRLVGGREHDAAADGNRLAAQARVK